MTPAAGTTPPEDDETPASVAVTRSPSAEDVPEPFSPLPLEKDNLKFELPSSAGSSVGHLFLFEYGVIVMWGLSLGGLAEIIVRALGKRGMLTICSPYSGRKSRFERSRPVRRR